MNDKIYQQVSVIVVKQLFDAPQAHARLVKRIIDLMLDDETLTDMQIDSLFADPKTSFRVVYAYLTKRSKHDIRVERMVRAVYSSGQSTSEPTLSPARQPREDKPSIHGNVVRVNSSSPGETIAIGGNVKGSIRTGDRHTEADNIDALEENTRFFISYRRSASQGFVAAFAKCLRDRTRGEIFVDTQSIEPGPFPARLKAAISRTDVVCFIITSGTLDRIHEPNDWVRIELEEALRLKKLIVPVLVEGASFPTETDLPISLHPLRMYTAKNIYYEQLESGVAALMAFVARA